jgi:hypothetical protein
MSTDEGFDLADALPRLSEAQARVLREALAAPRQQVDISRMPERLRERVMRDGSLRIDWAGTVAQRMRWDDARLALLTAARDLLVASVEHWAMALTRLTQAGRFHALLQARDSCLTEAGAQAVNATPDEETLP